MVEDIFLKAILRGKYTWRSIKSLSQETGLSEEDVKSLIDKFSNVVVKHKHLPDMWGHRYRVESN